MSPSPIRVVEYWAEAVVRLLIGGGLLWIGMVEGSGYGLLLAFAGVVFMVAGAGEIWFARCVPALKHGRAVGPGLHPALVKCEVPVLYATSEGQTRRIAERIASRLREKGAGAQAIDVTSSDADFIDWSQVRGTLVGASLHLGRHQRSAGHFVRDHARDLNRYTSAFFSVSLAVASDHSEERTAARHLADEFIADSGWHPDAVTCFAGRLAYTSYGLVTRLLMKHIARKQGGPTDTTRDYEFTNWNDVDHFAETFARMIGARPATHAA